MPTSRESDALNKSLQDIDNGGQPAAIGRLTGASYRDGRVLVIQGGLGKVQFAVYTLHALESVSDVQVALCLGSAGGLTCNVRIGDVVVATTTIEHDFNRKLIPGPLPEFPGDEESIAVVRENDRFRSFGFSVKFGRIASGDEGIVTTERAAELRAATGAIAAAWEGAGGARACEFAGVPFVEVRGISDMADEEAESAFFENVPSTMANLSKFLIEFIEAVPPA